MRGELVEDLGGAVGAAVVDDDDLEVRWSACSRRAMSAVITRLAMVPLSL